MEHQEAAERLESKPEMAGPSRANLQRRSSKEQIEYTVKTNRCCMVVSIIAVLIVANLLCGLLSILFFTLSTRTESKTKKGRHRSNKFFRLSIGALVLGVLTTIAIIVIVVEVKKAEFEAEGRNDTTPITECRGRGMFWCAPEPEAFYGSRDSAANTTGCYVYKGNPKGQGYYQTSVECAAKFPAPTCSAAGHCFYNSLADVRLPNSTETVVA